MTERIAFIFPHIIVVPDFRIFSSMWVTAQDVSGLLGLEIRQELLLKGKRRLKGLTDTILILTVGLMSLPIIGFIALLIKLTSGGPVFYRAKRIGRHGKPFYVYKFRTMVTNADEVLQQYLEEHPELREEWEKNFKLKHDPRITAIGRFLRKTSLDELPQLWNVIRGEMSLVGPRPIVEEEIRKYGPAYELYKRVKPGISGLWQVSGRSDTSYRERILFDTYYVRNWSPWLDLYIIARTIKTVLSCRGAY